jgi:hypothetical protein
MKEELLLDVEARVRERAYEKAAKPLFEILCALEQGSKTGGAPVLESQATRLAAAITQILTDTSQPFVKPMFLEFNRFKRCVTQVYQVSGYSGTSHLLKMIGKTDANGVASYAGQDLVRLFTGLSINAMSPELCDIFFQLDPQWSLPIMLGFLSEQALFTPQSEVVRSKILAAGKIWENVDVKPYYPNPNDTRVFPLNFTPAYMGCSYADAPHKHEIKKCLNKITRRWLEQNGVKDTPIPAERTLKARPKLVIFSEFYSPFHAMHRCYGPSIESLKEHFETTMVIADCKPHPELDKLAHKLETIDLPNDNPLPLIAKLQSLEPDILYLPSIGMRFSSIAVSNVRIAPIQVKSSGHPATTYSEMIDYAFLNVGHFAEHLHSEMAVLLDEMIFAKRPDATSLLPDIRLDSETVRLAVPAWSRKVTPRFLEACQRIQQTAKKKVEFWFFPNALGYLYQAVKRRYEGMLPGSVVLPTKNYNDYIRDINQCDVFLSTFPFGATNGIIDASIQGLPVVNMGGGEEHSRIDGIMAKMIGQPDWLTTNSVDEYVETVVKLIDNPSLRIQISRNILDKNPADIFFNTKSVEFPKGFQFIYKNNEMMKKSGRKIFEMSGI